MRKTGRNDVDLAIMSYDEKLRMSMRPTEIRSRRGSRSCARRHDCGGVEGNRFRETEKAIDVRT